MPERQEHWEQVYGTRRSTDVSWFERAPVTSMRLIEQVAPGTSAAVIDIGAGASLLVDGLLARGFADLTVLDISDHALSEVRRRLAEKAQRVSFLQRDVLTWTPDRQYEVWHDRAVFHFLTVETERGRYVETATSAVRGGGTLILATFAEDGPTRCSGLAVCRYTAPDLCERFSAAFSMVHHEREEHVTPSGVVQPFTWVVLQRT
jgi:2-polyprenyl-3-methyl-5-hydroxy-6-metoxy-1,4-benzoquinol methylase